MSKSKKQCLNIISNYLLNQEGNESFNDSLIRLEKTIKDIVESEYSFVWRYDISNNMIIHDDKNFSLGESLLQLTSIKKEVFFDNNTLNHKNYNNLVDNPLNINLKSIIILPIFQTEKLLGFLVAYNSINYNSNFKRYDTRSISLLTDYAKRLFTNFLEDKKVEKEKINLTVISKEKELKDKIIKQEKRIKELELLLDKNREFKKKLMPIEKFSVENNNSKKMKYIINFLNSELNYFSKNKNIIYTFLEIIKNSLHDEKQLEYIENQLKSSQLVHGFVDKLQNIEKMNLNRELFKVHQELLSVVSIYTRVFAKEKIFFNIFIDPKIPSRLLGDVEKIQSLIVHLFNNSIALTNKLGRIDFQVKYNREEAILKIIIKSTLSIEEKTLFNFFKKKSINSSLTTSQLGLGLTVASNLIKILNGKLKLKTEKKEEHSFSVLIPCLLPTNNYKVVKIFKSKKPIKIAILMSDNDKNYLYNLLNYLEAFSINEENIVVLHNYKKLKGRNFSHLFCFESMISDKINVSEIISISIFRYNDTMLEDKESLSVNQLHINSYYGMSLQKILFPDIDIEEIESNTILLECNRVNKNKKNKDVNSYVGQLRGFQS